MQIMVQFTGLKKAGCEGRKGKDSFAERGSRALW